MNWLVTGARGMLGRDVCTTLGGARHRAHARRPRRARPLRRHGRHEGGGGHDVVLNCAAWTAVDLAESHEDEAFEVNAVAAGRLARAAYDAGALVVQVSTDYVFDGDGRLAVRRGRAATAPVGVRPHQGSGGVGRARSGPGSAPDRPHGMAVRRERHLLPAHDRAGRSRERQPRRRRRPGRPADVDARRRRPGRAARPGGRALGRVARDFERRDELVRLRAGGGRGRRTLTRDRQAHRLDGVPPRRGASGVLRARSRPTRRARHRAHRAVAGPMDRGRVRGARDSTSPR